VEKAAAAMKSAREHILHAIAQHRGGVLDANAVAGASARLLAHKANTIPARSQGSATEQVELFTRMAQQAAATVTVLAHLADAPRAIAEYLRAQNLPCVLRLGPDQELNGLPWSLAPSLQITSGGARPEDEVSLTPAFAAIAETGTLMLISGEHQPTALNFLPDTHIVVLAKSAIVGAYEEALMRLRRQAGPAGWPRTINWITGPSRTADIEQTLVMGAHGPRRLYILIANDS
jgi:L-lactate dehydrogenase complex protein LldG